MSASRFLINGEWRSSAKTRSVINPYSNSSIGEVYQASSGDIDSAIAAAATAFTATRKLQSYERAEILRFIAEQIEAQKEVIARLITAETGKPISFSRAEVARSIFTFLVAAEESQRIGGEVIPLDLASNSATRIGITRRFPVGVMAAITPFNFPLNLVAHKVAPAIASGNSMVLKPSSNSPLTALQLGEIVDKSPLPKGALNIVPCDSHEAQQLITDKRVKQISFTGSPAVGWDIKGKSGNKKVTLELGGNAAVIVETDADLDFATKRIAHGAYGNAGQSCIAVQRIIVHQDIVADFSERFLKLTKSMILGDPGNPRTIVGPMISQEAAQKIEKWIQEAADEGALLLCGGTRKGATLEPTVLANVNSSMKISCEEVFAPVVTVEEYGSFEKAVEMVNNSRFGLQAGVFTHDINKVFYAFRELEVGGVIINDYPTYRIDHMPYGGVKDSGLGREGIRFAIEEMTELKLLALNLG